MNATLWLLVTIITAPAFIYVLYNYVLDIPKRKASLNWPVTKGIVTNSRINVDDFEDLCSVSVWYRYSVNGHEYSSSRYKAGSNFSCTCVDSEEGEQYLRSYPIDKIVDVYYDPENPSYSARKRGFPLDIFQ